VGRERGGVGQRSRGSVEGRSGQRQNEGRRQRCGNRGQW
jgi:hypothetical protein